MNVDDRIKVDGRLSKGEVLLDRYRIVRLIGEGGFADVYEASDLQEGRQVALKILHQVDGHKRQQTIRRRFILEAELVAQVKHPDVVELFDFGVTSDGRLFISLELLKGQTLEDALYRNGAMEPAHALRLVVRCLEALQSAHDLGIVHRDLKPSNLFVGRDADGVERLRILDFGIAFLTDEVSNRMTRTGQINGTPQYLAPEYIQQQVVTKALDVYQLALILVEMCTGVQVVSDDNPYKCLMAHVAGKLNLPEALMATSWGPVLRTALAADHEQRYADAAAFREALLPLLNGADAMHVYADDAVRRATGERRKERKLEHVLPVQIEVRNQDTPVALDRNAQLDDTHSQLIANPTPSRQGGNTKLIIVVVAVALVVAAATYLGVSHFIGQAGSPKTVSTLPPPPTPRRTLLDPWLRSQQSPTNPRRSSSLLTRWASRST